MSNPITSDEDKLRSANANRCLLLGFGAPIVFFGGLFVILPTDNPALSLSWLLFFFIHGFASLLAGSSARDGATPLQINNVKWRVRLGTLAVTLSMLFIGAISLVYAIFAALAGSPSTCRDVLENSGHALYAEAQALPKGEFPPLSANPGEFTMANAMTVAEAEAEGFPTNLRCPSAPNTMDYANGSVDTLEAAGDTDFFYLGYAIDSPQTLKAFETAYRDVIAAGGNFEGDLPVPPGQGTWGGDVIRRLSPNLKDSAPVPEVASNNTRRLRPAVYRIPVIIERVGHHPDGRPNSQGYAHVLNLAGNVDRLPYPGPWPMDEETMAVLDALDALGPLPVEAAAARETGGRRLMPWIAVAALALLLRLFWSRIPGFTVRALALYLAYALAVFIVLPRPVLPATITPPGGHFSMDFPADWRIAEFKENYLSAADTKSSCTISATWIPRDTFEGDVLKSARRELDFLKEDGQENPRHELSVSSSDIDGRPTTRIRFSQFQHMAMRGITTEYEISYVEYPEGICRIRAIRSEIAPGKFWLMRRIASSVKAAATRD